MSSIRNLHWTGPRKAQETINVDIPDIQLDPSQEINLSQTIERMYDKFSLCDDVRNWHSIPKKVMTLSSLYYATSNIPFTGSVDVDCVVIPFVNLNSFNPSWFDVIDVDEDAVFKRRLNLNVLNTIGVAAGDKMPIPITRRTRGEGENLETAKAYLHGISFAAYDFNEPIPYVDVPALCEALTGLANTESEVEWNYESLKVEDAFGDGYHGFIIGIYDTSKYVFDSRDYITANYPLLVNTDTFSNAKGKRFNELKVMTKLSQGAPRSSVFRGILPSDWMSNNFGIEIGGLTSTDFNSEDTEIPDPTNLIYDSRNRLLFADTNNYSQSFGENAVVGLDEFFPAIYNEIDILIPDNIDWLTIDVRGPGWFHGIDLVDHNIQYYFDPVKGWLFDASQTPNRGTMPVTLVQMPVKVKLDIRYAFE